MGTLKDILSRRFNTAKPLCDYELYKYENIEQKCIIYQGHLQYLYTTFLGDSFFRNYLVVLTRIPVENLEDLIGLYLFSDEKKSASYFFSIDQKTKINDQYVANIRPIPKCFLMELKFIEKDKSEIFGAKDHSERQIWVEMFRKVVSKPKASVPISDYLQAEHIDKSVNPSTSAIDHRPFYPTFDRVSRMFSRIDKTIHFSLSQIDVKYNVHNDKSRSATESDSELSTYSIVEPTDYSRSKTNSLSRIESPSKTNLSHPQDNVFIWNEVFYSNENDDFKSILTKTGEYGAFLVRPQSKTTSSNDHDYTLCVYYESNKIRCFPIYQLPQRRNEYSLTKNDRKGFVDIAQLCQYYTTNSLPMATKNIYLKNSYKFYENNSYYIE